MDDISFLEAKLEAYVIALDGQSGEGLRMLFGQAIAELKARSGSRATAKRIYQSMDQFIGSIGPRSFGEEVRRRLRARYGFDRIGPDPGSIVGRVLKRGTIVSDNEAGIIRDCVANLENEDVIGTDNFARLALILDQTGY